MTDPPAAPGPGTRVPPARRDEATYRVAIVCLGNICRSPMAQVVLTRRLRDAGLGERVDVVSAGTGDWHIGEPMDPRAAELLSRHGYDASGHRAAQFGPEWFADVDLVLAMDGRNRRAIAMMSPGTTESTTGSRVRMFRDFDPFVVGQPAADLDVPDPWYGEDDGFDTVLGMVERTASGLVDALRAEVGDT